MSYVKSEILHQFVQLDLDLFFLPFTFYKKKTTKNKKNKIKKKTNCETVARLCGIDVQLGKLAKVWLYTYM